jgi:hypothetical protein
MLLVEKHGCLTISCAIMHIQMISESRDRVYFIATHTCTGDDGSQNVEDLRHK